MRRLFDRSPGHLLGKHIIAANVRHGYRPDNGASSGVDTGLSMMRDMACIVFAGFAAAALLAGHLRASAQTTAASPTMLAQTTCETPPARPDFIRVRDTFGTVSVYDIHGRRAATYHPNRQFLYVRGEAEADGYAPIVGRYAVTTGAWSAPEITDITAVRRTAHNASYGERMTYHDARAERVDAMLTVLGVNCRPAGTPNPLRPPADELRGLYAAVQETDAQIS